MHPKRRFNKRFWRHLSFGVIYDRVVQVGSVQPVNCAVVVVRWLRPAGCCSTAEDPKNVFGASNAPVRWHFAQPLSLTIFVCIISSGSGSCYHTTAFCSMQICVSLKDSSIFTTTPHGWVVGGSGDDKGFDRFQCVHFGALSKIEIPAHLQVQPEIGRIAKELCQP